MSSPPAEGLGGQVDDLDLFGAAQETVRDGLALRDAGDLLDNIVQGLDVLNVEGGDHIDPRREQLLYVLPAFVVLRSGRVGVGEFIDQRDGGLAVKHRVQVHFFEGDAPVFHAGAGHTREPLGHGRGSGTAVGFHDPDDDVFPVCEQAPTVFEHREGFADPGGSPEQHPKLPPFRHVQPSNSSTAMFSSRTFTLDSPR